MRPAVITICNRKGGTGKTSVAINLAAYLSRLGKKVLLIDLDPQANATSGLGITNNDKGIYEVLSQKISLTDSMIAARGNLWLSPSSENLAGADVEKIALAMGLDKRIGKDFLQAGIGYGGFCFPKDVEAFAYISKKLGYDFGLLKEVKAINEKQWSSYVEKVKEHLWIVKGKKIAILGLSFKPDTDDMRFAPSVDIVKSFY